MLSKLESINDYITNPDKTETLFELLNENSVNEDFRKSYFIKAAEDIVDSIDQHKKKTNSDLIKLIDQLEFSLPKTPLDFSNVCFITKPTIPTIPFTPTIESQKDLLFNDDFDIITESNEYRKQMPKNINLDKRNDEGKGLVSERSLRVIKTSKINKIDKIGDNSLIKINSTSKQNFPTRKINPIKFSPHKDKAISRPSNVCNSEIQFDITLIKNQLKNLIANLEYNCKVINK